MKNMSLKKVTSYLTVSLVLFVFCFIGACSPDSITKQSVKEPDQGDVASEDEITTTAEEKKDDKQVTGKYKNEVLYFEIGIDEGSKHFEHRVANLYATGIKGQESRLIYSDIDDFYGLSEVFGISPDNKKILCRISDDAKGLYNTICYIDIDNGSLHSLKEYDFENEEELSEGAYGRPVWSNDSEKVAMLTVKNPYRPEISFGHLSIIDINTKTEKKIDIKEELIAGNNILSPVLFNSDSSGLYVTVKQLMQKIEDDIVLGAFEKYEGIAEIDIDSGDIDYLLDADEVKNIDPETISSMDNFSLVEGLSTVVFDLLLDFEDDGDIYALNTSEKTLRRITGDKGFREQQPTVAYSDGDITVAYTAVNRYGTISNDLKTGSILITEGFDAEKTTDTMQIGKDPAFSDDGSYLAFLDLELDENNEYIKQYTVKIYDLSSGDTNTIFSSAGILFLVGWI